MGNQPGQAGNNRSPSGVPTPHHPSGMPLTNNLRGMLSYCCLAGIPLSNDLFCLFYTGLAQRLNALAALHQQYSGGNRSPNMLQGGYSLSRWFPPEILAQAGGQMHLPPLPSLEELKRLHTSVSHRCRTRKPGFPMKTSSLFFHTLLRLPD